MSALVRVPFHGDELLVQPGATPGSTLVVMRPICERLGLDWKSQHAKLASHPVLGTCMVLIRMQVGGQAREVAALPLDRFPFWLATIQTGRIPNLETRALVLRYQIESARVLFEYFFPSSAPATPGIAASVAPGGITASTIGGITKGVMHKALGEHLVPIAVDLADQRAAIAALTAKVDQITAAVGGKVQNPTPAPAGAYTSALVLLIELGCPQKGRRAMVNAVSGRLAWFCAQHGYPTRVTAERGIRLFHRDAIAAWRRAGGDAYLAACGERMRGQAA